jgi:hypothetical protein
MNIEKLAEEIKERKDEYLDCYNPEFREGNGLFNRLFQTKEIEAKKLALIYKWKLRIIKESDSRAIKENIHNFRDAIEMARHDGKEIEAVNKLDTIPGCGLAVASTILSIYCPDKFSIIDRRVLQVLGYTNKKSTTDGWNAKEYWEEYMKKIKDISILIGTNDLRTTDKILWGKSLSDQIDSMLAL